jgi:putative thiazole-containing bacteriocin maturation protein
MIMTTMRPKLMGDTLYIPLADGVYFRNNQRAFKIKGKVIYRWIEQLAPYLDGQHTLEEITDGLDPERRAMVTDLVTTLLTNHFLKDTSHDLPHTLSTLERTTYAPEIAFIDSFCDSAASRFERFRNHQVLVIGSGLTLTGLVHASLKCGLRQLAVITTHECETHTQRHQEYLDLFHKSDPEQTLREIAAPDWGNEAEVLTVLQPFDTILHISDQPMLARTRMLNRLCVTHAKNFLQAIVVDDHAWIGPLVRPGVDGCWECAWRRLQGNLVNMQEQFSCYDFRDQSAFPTSRFIALPTSALIANQLSFELFKYVTEAGPVGTVQKLIEVDLETLRSQPHPFLPHPLCHTCQHPVPRTVATFVDTIHQLEQGEPLDQDLFSKRAAPCFETRLGLFSLLDEDDFVQLPLSVCKAVVSQPMPQENLGNPPTVLGIGGTFRTSRQRATLRACEVYACSLLDRRLLPSREIQQELSIPADRFLCEAPLAEVKEWVWASDLQSGQACLVPAALVYPALRGLSPDSETRLGIGSGMSWAEALSRGLLSLCQHLTVTHLRDRQKPYPQVDLAATPLEPEGTSQRHALALIKDEMDEILTVYNVTGPLQVPTFAFCSGEKTIAYHAQFTVAQALREGLETALLTWQLSREQTPVVSALPELPFSLRGSGTSVSSYEIPQEWPERLQWLQLALQKQQWSAFAVPLDHDPALREVLPYIACVLLGRTEKRRKGVSSL